MLSSSSSSSSSSNMWHGLKAQKHWSNPKLVAASDEANRADQGNNTKANEYLDDKKVLDEKMEIVAQLIRQSKFCCAYTGAGLSKSSGIPDYATKAKDSIVKAPKLKSSLDAEPTYAHCVLTSMERAGYLHHYVQQNHDGLPQKSGFPQEKINEIHGAWFDPSNPVVMFGGSLRGDLFDWMAETEKKVDLCLCLGTSLSGMNADRMAVTPAKKSLKRNPTALGTVIINIQQTSLDASSVVRVWAKLDDAFAILAKKLNLHDIRPLRAVLPAGDVFEVPYNAEGWKDESVRMALDLRDGARVFIPVEEAMNAKAVGEIFTKKNGHYSVHLEEKNKTVARLFGNWWVEGALRGSIPRLPVINIDPIIRKVNEKEKNVDMTRDCSSPVHNNDENNNNINTKIIIPDAIDIIQSHSIIPGAKEGGNKHKWGLEIHPDMCKYVDNVVWTLHPTFHPPEVTCTEAPFNINRLGWGTFTVKARVTLKLQYGGDEFKAKHELTFDMEGAAVKVTKVKCR